MFVLPVKTKRKRNEKNDTQFLHLSGEYILPSEQSSSLRYQEQLKRRAPQRKWISARENRVRHALFYIKKKKGKRKSREDDDQKKKKNTYLHCFGFVLDEREKWGTSISLYMMGRRDWGKEGRKTYLLWSSWSEGDYMKRLRAVILIFFSHI